MNQLETLLNSLIKMGWKPWGKLEANECTVEYQKQVCVWNKHYRMLRKGSFRELVSIESGLWRFVCMHSLISEKADMRDYREDSYGFQDRVYDKDGFYWMMKCARIPEDKLGQFLIDNIKPE